MTDMISSYRSGTLFSTDVMPVVTYKKYTQGSKLLIDQAGLPPFLYPDHNRHIQEIKKDAKYDSVLY